MKNKFLSSTVALLFFATSQICGCGCKATAQTKQEHQTLKTESKTVNLKITGMTCGGCAKAIHNALSKQAGILENEVKYPGDMAIIKYNPAKISEKEIIAVIEKVGYKAEVVEENEKKMRTGMQKILLR